MSRTSWRCHISAVAAPLSYGQLSVLRFVQDVPRHQWSPFTIGRYCPLADHVSVEDVHAALETVWRRHESLRTTYRFRGVDPPVQVVHPRPESVVGSVELTDHPDGADCADGGERRLAERLLRTPFCLDEDDFGWRATVLTWEGRPTALVFADNHIVADGWSLDLIEADLGPLLRDQRPPPVPNPPAGSPTELAREQRSAAWSDRRQATNRYWHGLIDSGLLAPMSGDPASGHHAGRGDRLSGRLPLGALAGLISTLARRYRVFPQGLLLAMTALGFADLTGAGECPVWLVSSNRADPRWQGLVTSMNQFVPIAVSLDPGEPLSSFVRRVQVGSTQVHQHACYDLDEVAAAARDRLGAPLEIGCLFNYAMSDWPRSPGPDDMTRIPWAEPVLAASGRPAVATFYVLVSYDLAITAHVDRALFPEESVRRFLHTVEAWLRAAYANPDGTVGALRDAAVAGRQREQAPGAASVGP